MDILLKSAFQKASQEDGRRYLIETFWPKKIQTHALMPYRWFRELVPSPLLLTLAKKNKWTKEQLRRAYWMELMKPSAQRAIEILIEENGEGAVTLLYSADHPFQSYAYYLKEYLRQYCQLPSGTSCYSSKAA